MEGERQVAKRQRTGEGPSSIMSNSSSQATSNDVTVASLIKQRLWEEATERVKAFPEEASPPTDPSPLALACRLGAPASCVTAVLQACPQRLRRVVDSRGTPLHEAIVCENVGADVIQVLLEADEALGTDTTRATLLQDVDGFTPLHVLIRRRFQSHILTDDGLIQMLEMLVKSCAQAVVVPDRGEYEEPPIVYALKANLYAPLLGSEDETTARVERRIYEMVACMLEHYPEAACCVLAGYRGQYTAVHSAVFHGRSPHTLELLLKAEEKCQRTSKACMLANTQGEMPLHFSTMRGEPPQSVALLAKSAPAGKSCGYCSGRPLVEWSYVSQVFRVVLQHLTFSCLFLLFSPAAVHTRDASGLMPTHWLWVRYVSSLVALEDGGRGSDDTVRLEVPNQAPPNISSYSEFSSFEQGNLENDLLVIRRLDPSVDFLRMRHIPLEVLGDEDSLRWAARTAELLEGVRERHAQVASRTDEDENGWQIEWKRQEAIASLFWTKLVSLLEASREVGDQQPIGENILVHTAFANACFLPAMIRLVATLYPEELQVQDQRGRLPLHYAASREWHDLDWPSESSSDGNTARPARLFQMETLASLRSAMELSREDAASVVDKDGRLPLHYMVDSFVKATNKRASDQPIQEMLDLMTAMVQLYPDALHKCDGKTQLCPGFQATAVATECAKKTNVFTPELHLSIPFILLRENPTLISQHSVV